MRCNPNATGVELPLVSLGPSLRWSWGKKGELNRNRDSETAKGKIIKCNFVMIFRVVNREVMMEDVNQKKIQLHMLKCSGIFSLTGRIN